MMKKMNWYLRLGLLIYCIVISVNHFIKLPESIHGFGLGVAIALEMIGIYSFRHDMIGVKNLKKKLISKLIKPA